MQIDNVADMSAETLIQAGVKRIFGVVGDSLNGLTEGGARRSIGFTFAMRRWPLSPRQARRRRALQNILQYRNGLLRFPFIEQKLRQLLNGILVFRLAREH